jgi:hypothetical protein
MEKRKLNILLDESLMSDINKALEYAFDFNYRLDESWLGGTSSTYFKEHYRNHVLQDAQGEKWTEYPSKSSDGEYRIKMPPMTPEEYEYNADKLASETNVKSHTDRYHSYIGGVVERVRDGIKKENFVKIRRNSGYVIEPKHTVDGKPKNLRNMCEIVVYIKAPDGSNLIITYMMARNVNTALLNFNWISDLPKSEINDSENKTYYLCVDRYKTTNGEDYFEVVKFESYLDASKYFQGNKKTSKLIKVENQIRKTISEKNLINVVPEVKNKNNDVDNNLDAVKLLNRNDF